MISAYILDEIRARLPVSMIVASRVRLRKAGREWVGLSPFNAEKTPSFYANDQKQRWFDHSAGKDGDIFAFVMETEGLGFTEVVERLAADAGVELPKDTPEAQARAQRQRGLVEVVEMAASYFESILAGAEGAAARSYLDRRGILPSAREAYRLGMALDRRNALREHLTAKGIATETMVEAGLLILPEDGSPAIDRFRGRIIFPIADGRGRIVGFGGRTLQDGRGPKYLNSPETPVFDKGRLLYNLHRARTPAHELGEVYVVEGNVDVIAMEGAGYPNTVASLGTALGAAQLDLLWHVVQEPTLLFDGDAAGRRACSKAIDTALPHLAPGRSLRIATLPAGVDPDDLARSGGRDAISRVLMARRPLIDALWARELSAGPHDTPETRSAVEARLMDAAGLIQHPSVRANYRSELRNRLRMRFGARRLMPGKPSPLSAAALSLMDRPIPIEDDAIGLAEELRIAADEIHATEAGK